MNNQDYSNAKLDGGDGRSFPEELVRQDGGGGESCSSLTENLLGEMAEISVINTNLGGLETNPKKKIYVKGGK